MHCPHCYRYISDEERAEKCPTCHRSVKVDLKEKTGPSFSVKQNSDFEKSIASARDAARAGEGAVKIPGIISLARILNVLAGIVILLAISAVFLSAFVKYDKIDFLSFLVLAVITSPFLALALGLFSVSGALGRFKPWARNVQIVISSFGLLGFPIGTLLHGLILYRLGTDKKLKALFIEEPTVTKPEQSNLRDIGNISGTGTIKKTRNSHRKELAAALAVLLCVGGGGTWAWHQLQSRDTFTADPRALIRPAGELGASESAVDADLRKRKASAEAIEACLLTSKLETCLDMARAAKKIYPDEPAFAFYEIALLHDLNRKEEAFKLLDQISSVPNFGSFVERVGAQAYLMLAMLHTSAGQIEIAKSYEDKASALNESSPQVKLGFAKLKAFQKNLGGMIHDYEQAIRAGAEKYFSWVDYFLLAAGYLETFNPKDFGRIFAKSRERFMHSPGFHLLLSLQHLRDQRFASAYYEILFEREVDLTRGGYFTEAIDAIERVFMQAVDDPNVLPERGMEGFYTFLQGMKLYKQNRMAEAAEKMMLSVRIGEAHPLQSVYIARALTAVGRREEALQFYQQVSGDKLAFARIYAEQAQLLWDLNRQEEAKKFWQQALASDPEVEIFYDLGKKWGPAPPVPQKDAVQSVAPAADPVIQSQTQAKVSAEDIQIKSMMNQLVINQFQTLMANRSVFAV